MSQITSTDIRTMQNKKQYIDFCKKLMVKLQDISMIICLLLDMGIYKKSFEMIANQINNTKNTTIYHDYINKSKEIF